MNAIIISEIFGCINISEIQYTPICSEKVQAKSSSKGNMSSEMSKPRSEHSHKWNRVWKIVGIFDLQNNTVLEEDESR